ncbi:MAG: histidine kinase [Allomuricauda sp.]|nr:MAG: histidine kinase [Allomuricauda sp.]
MKIRIARIGFIVTFLWVFTSAMGQSFSQSVPNPFLEFQNVEGHSDKFDFFFGAPNRYSENSAYDWLEVVNVYLSSAKKIADSSAIQSYEIIRAKIYSDLEDFDKSVNLANGLYENKELLPENQKRAILNILDDSYANLKLYDKQIEVREAKINEGFNENISFYDIYAAIGLYEEARNRYIMEVKPTIADNDSFSLAKYHNQIGDYLRLDNSERVAISEYKKALGYLEVFINSISVDKTEQELFESDMLKAIINGNIGKCHVQLNEYREAVPLLESSIAALEDAPGAKSKRKIVENTLDLAEAHLQLENYREAKTYLDRQFDSISVFQEIKKNRLLAAYYDKNESYRRASFFYKRNERLKDSLETNESSVLKQQLVAIVANEDLENSQRMFEEQKSANELIRNEMQAKEDSFNLVLISLFFTLLGFAGLVYAYLKSIKNQRLIAEQKHIIESSLTEKDSLLKEIHHRVKNNLQMVSSLLSLQTKNTRSKAAIAALEEGKSRVKAMALIHQKLYQNDDLSVIEMQGYIESLINSVQSVYKKGGHNISITIDAEGTELDIDRAIPFGLILNELVSNSFKYAFPESDENGKIYIHLRKNGEQGYFEYSDNGIGLPDDTDERTHSSMGLRLINRLVNQLQSKLNVDRSNDGVRFWFNFS